MGDDDSVGIKDGFLRHLAELQNFRVEYSESRTLTPPSTVIADTKRPDSPIHAGQIGKVLYGRFDSNCVFATADASHCLYQRELTAETAKRLRDDKMDHARFEQLIYSGQAATQFHEMLDGRLTRYFLEGFPRPNYDAGMDVNLGLRFIGENQPLDKQRVAAATATSSGGKATLTFQGRGGSSNILTVDPQKGYTVIRYEIKLDGELLEECISDQFDEVKPGLFLPERVMTRDFYDDGKNQSQHCEFAVQRYLLGHESLRWYLEHSTDPPKYQDKSVTTRPILVPAGASAEPAEPSMVPSAAPVQRSSSRPGDNLAQGSVGPMRKNGPLIYEEAFDLGNVIPGAEMTHSFFMVNLGSSKLNITKLTTSCGCTTASAAADFVDVDRVLRIPVTVKLLEGMRGDFVERVLLEFADERVGSVVLELRGTVWTGSEIEKK